VCISVGAVRLQGVGGRGWTVGRRAAAVERGGAWLRSRGRWPPAAQTDHAVVKLRPAAYKPPKTVVWLSSLPNLPTTDHWFAPDTLAQPPSHFLALQIVRESLVSLIGFVVNLTDPFL